MSKKEKAVFTLAEDFQAISTLVPRLEAFMKVHKEIAAGYQKYKKNGGESIPGIEKHLGIKESKSTTSTTKKEAATIKEKKTPKDADAIKKDKKSKSNQKNK